MIQLIRSKFRAYFKSSLPEEIQIVIARKRRQLIQAQQVVLDAVNTMVQIEEELDLLHLWNQSLEQDEETLLDIGYDYRSIGVRDFSRTE